MSFRKSGSGLKMEETTPTSKLVIFLILLLILGSSSFLLYKAFVGVKPAISLATGDLSSFNEECREISQQIQDGVLDIVWVDEDKDNYYDGCDICRPGDNNKDEDLDGMPDACDKKRKNPKVTECINKWDKDENACVLS